MTRDEPYVIWDRPGYTKPHPEKTPLVSEILFPKKCGLHNLQILPMCRFVSQEKAAECCGGIWSIKEAAV